MSNRTNALVLVVAGALAACGSSSDPSGDASKKDGVSSADDAGTSGPTDSGSNGILDNGDASASAPGTTGDDDGPPPGDHDAMAPPEDATAADTGTSPTDSGTDAADAAPLAPSLVGTWVPATSTDAQNCVFTSLTIDAAGNWSETGNPFDGSPANGTYTQPATFTLDSSYGAPPAGIHGPYLELTESSAGDGAWVYGGLVESADSSMLTLTLYSQRFGMGLRWATVKTMNLVKGTASPVGSWKPATTTDKTNAGFATLIVDVGGTWTETGRTDGDTMPAGNVSEPLSISIDSSYGNPPAGIHGPYLELAETSDNDGEWIYAFSEAADKSTLTLTLYAKTNGMGLRWASPPVTINLVPN